jgi:hypothetical protein
MQAAEIKKCSTRLSNQTVLQTRMRSRKIAIARHCRRGRACAYPAIRDGWPAIARTGFGCPKNAIRVDSLVYREGAKLHIRRVMRDDATILKIEAQVNKLPDGETDDD